MDLELTKYLTGLGIGGVLATIIYIQGNKNSERHAEQINGLLIIERGRTDLLIGVIKDATVAITRNTIICEALHRRLDEDNNNRRESRIQ